VDEKPIECPLCRIGKYPYFSYSGSGACDHCVAVWTYDEGDTLTEDSPRRLWEKVPRWIPVSERLPEQREDVLVFTQYGTHVAARNEYGEWYPSHGDGWQFPEPTHWMPMPVDPPESK